jgi:precorrin-2 dehydrogenase/sirohydrochlorin ferrochelatase
MDVFPAAFPLSGLTLVVAGEGEAADAKARLFEGSPATLVRIAGADAGRSEAYAGARLVFLAISGSAAIKAAAAARAAGALVNVVDRPELCDFNTPAIVDRGSVVGAVATGGAAPLLAAELRREIEARWPAGLGGAATLLRRLQDEVRAALPAVADRRAWLRRLLDGEAPGLAMAGGMDAALALARRSLAEPASAGRLSLLVPPASLDLLSLRALQALSRADRLVVAEGVATELVALARRDAPVSRWATVSAEAVAEEVALGGSVVCVGPAAVFEGLGVVEVLPIAAG